VLDPSDGTIQVMALSRRNMAEYQFSERDRAGAGDVTEARVESNLLD